MDWDPGKNWLWSTKNWRFSAGACCRKVVQARKIPTKAVFHRKDYAQHSIIVACCEPLFCGYLPPKGEMSAKDTSMNNFSLVRGCQRRPSGSDWFAEVATGRPAGEKEDALDYYQLRWIIYVKKASGFVPFCASFVPYILLVFRVDIGNLEKTFCVIMLFWNQQMNLRKNIVQYVNVNASEAHGAKIG